MTQQVIAKKRFTTEAWEAAVKREVRKWEAEDQQSPQYSDDAWRAAMDQERALIEAEDRRDSVPSYETRQRLSGEVDATFQRIQNAGADADLRSFRLGAVAAFLAVYGRDGGCLPVEPPTWELAEERGTFASLFYV